MSLSSDYCIMYPATGHRFGKQATGSGTNESFNKVLQWFKKSKLLYSTKIEVIDSY